MSAPQPTPEAENILNQYKGMMAECQSIASKISELKNEKEEHRLVVESLSKLEDERKAFRLIGGVLVEKTVGEVLPVVNQNYSGIQEILLSLDKTLTVKDAERKTFKEKHGIMTTDERDALMKKGGQIKQ